MIKELKCNNRIAYIRDLWLLRYVKRRVSRAQLITIILYLFIYLQELRRPFAINPNWNFNITNVSKHEKAAIVIKSELTIA